MAESRERLLRWCDLMERSERRAAAGRALRENPTPEYARLREQVEHGELHPAVAAPLLVELEDEWIGEQERMKAAG